MASFKVLYPRVSFTELLPLATCSKGLRTISVTSRGITSMYIRIFSKARQTRIGLTKEEDCTNSPTKALSQTPKTKRFWKEASCRSFFQYQAVVQVISALLKLGVIFSQGVIELKLKICLSGATGHVGQELVKGISKSNDLELVACLGSSTVGKRLPEILRFPCPDIFIHNSVHKALEKQPFDILIDYTTPDSVFQTIFDSISNGVNCVIGTSGLSDELYDKLDRLALRNNVGIFAAGNFSITAALLTHFSQFAAAIVPHWELFDYAPDTKPDAPSGTTRELAYLLGEIGHPKYAVLPENVHGDLKSRGANLNGSQVHSVRVPGFYSSSEAVFGLPGERLSIRHDSISYTPYVEGTLLAARKVNSMKGLVRGMNNILGFKKI